METLETIVKGGDAGTALVAGKSAESLLFTRAVGGDDSIMPPEDNGVGAKSLSPEELGLLKLWIDQGAKDDDHEEGAKSECVNLVGQP